MSMTDGIHEHYTQPALSARIEQAARAAGIGPGTVTPETTRTFDQFHTGGITTTRELARRAGLRAGETVLDLGSGIGGAARTLAAEFGGVVTGLDLIDEYTGAARLLTAWAGLADRVTFDTGDMLAMPYGDASFDAVWSQHVIMNIADKARLLAEIRRVLKPGGRYAFHEVCAGDMSPPHYPVPWATDASHSYLISPAEFRHLIEGHGLRATDWRDTTHESAEWFRSVPARSQPGNHPSPLGLHLLMGPAARDKFLNTLRNLEEGRIRVVMGVAAD